MTPALLCTALLFGQTPDDPTAFINQHFAAHWRAQKITPSSQCSDHEFLRRASLDLIGRIPTVPEIDAFMKDPPAERRRLLIDRLLAHAEAPRHWANVWSAALLGSAGDAAAREEFHGWLQQHFASNGTHRELARKLITAKGSTRANPAVHFFVAYRGQMLPKDQWERSGQYDMFTVTNHMVRVFHGRRLQCVQCHEHPFDSELQQHQFHGMNAFFRQVEFKTERVGKSVIESIDDNPDFNKSGLASYERRNGIIMFSGPTFLDGKRLPRGFNGTRREAMADFIAASPWFTKAYVHRMWAHFFGRGLCETPDADDLGDHNPVVHAAVLDRLTKAFVASGQDANALMRWICLSEPYGLSNVANRTNMAPELAVAFARHQLRPLTNHQLVESLLTVHNAAPARRVELRRAWLKELNIAALSVAQECEFEPAHTLGDLPLYRMLWMLPHTSLKEALGGQAETLSAITAKHPKASTAAVRALFLHAVSRPPSESEIRRLTDPKLLARLQGDGGNDAKAAYSHRDFYADLFWALLNSNEFAFNH